MPDEAPAGRRHEILSAALQIAGEQGIDAITHRAVADRAGIPLGSTTYYFASKEELIEDALRLAIEREIERIDERAEELSEGSRTPGAWADVFSAWLEEQMTGEARTALIAQYELQLEAARRPPLRELCERWTMANQRLAERHLEEVGSPCPVVDARLLIAAVDGLRLFELSVPNSPKHARAVREAIERQISLMTAG